MLRHTIIRRFAGTLADAEGLLAVERATFDESPYSAEQVQAMLTGGAQRAWLAVNGGQVIGFVAAFPTSGLRGPCWEIDLLAVHPEWTGQRLATRLIRTAASGGMQVARRARAAVAGDNAASARAFLRAGFRRVGACTLYIHQIKGQSPRPWTALGVTVREAASLEEAARWLPEDTVSPVSGGSATRHEPQGEGSAIHLLAEYHGQPAGYGELIPVQTLLYRGLWIESLVASKQTVRVALVNEALTRAISMGLDEIGMMVPESEPSLQETFLAAGFRSLGDFDWLRADLPLPGLAAGV
ncbi:MAG: GNAT family N-acetyltransferase [Anaerolineae bacterium]|jgi:ribosomal protein S18 acetylase RimI-like enzyme